MSNFFYADKGSRENAFKFDQNPSAENTAVVHPFPEVLAVGQKVGQPSTGADTTSYEGSPFGNDRNNLSHIQTPSQSGDKTMPGEQEDPRC